MKLALQNFPLMGDKTTQHLFQVFKDAGVTARFVGGCVRDAILGRAAQDIDLAVPIPPDETICILTDAHIKVIPTGYEFGTITAVFDSRVFQITSLRQDWEPDGRRARVTYGMDWKVDAARRDFTINALYADADGTVIDFFEGLDDLAQGVVRFIGDPHQRICEDFLRILRYFRFLAWYGKESANVEAIQACIDLRCGLKSLSRERIGHEFLKLLAAPNPLMSLSNLDQANITPYIIPHSLNLKAFQRLMVLETTPIPDDFSGILGPRWGGIFNPILTPRVGSSEGEIEDEKISLDLSPNLKKIIGNGCIAHSLRRLAALSLPSIDVKGLCQSLRLSKEQKQYLQLYHDRLHAYPSIEKTISRNLYKDGPDLFVGLTLLSFALNPSDTEQGMMGEAFKAACMWQHPIFPLKGKDLIQIGLKPGTQIGDFLKQCEEWWIEQDFKPDRGTCLKWIRKQNHFPSRHLSIDFLW